MRFKQILIMVVILLFAGPAWGATYYTTYAGAGAKNGTNISNAWSIAELEAASLSGDDVVYLSGDFDFGSTTEELNLTNKNGTDGHKITIDCTDGVNPNGVFKANRGEGQNARGIEIATSSYLIIRDCTFYSGSTERYPMRITESNNIDIINVSLNGAHDHGIEIYNGSSDTHTILIKGCDLKQANDPVWLSDDGIWIDSQNGTGDIYDITIEENDLSGWDHAAIQAAGFTGVSNCGNIYNLYVRRNLFLHDITDSSGYGRAFTFNSSEYCNTYNVYVNHNYFDKHFTSNQFSGVYNVYVWGNIFDEAQGCCASTLWAGCAGRDTNTCGTSVNGEYCPSTGFTGNYNVACHFLKFSNYRDATSVPDSDNVKIFNNTFYGNNESLIHADHQMDNLEIENNICLENSRSSDPCDDPPGSEATHYDYSIALYGPVGANFSLKNNTIYSTRRLGGNEANIGGGTSPTSAELYTVAEMNAAAWGDSNLEDDADLTDVSNELFYPIPTSNTIGAGLDKGNDTDDCVASTNEYACGLYNTVTKADFGMADNLKFVSHDEAVAGWTIGAYVQPHIAPTISKPTASQTNWDYTAPYDESMTITFVGADHYATDWKVVLAESDCISGTAQGTQSLCDATNKTTYDYPGLSGGISYKLCSRTIVDLDGGSDCDSGEYSAWSTQLFSTGAGSPVAYGATMSDTAASCGGVPCGATMSDTPADCGGVPCGATMAE